MAALPQSGVKESRLQTRLAARYNTVLAEFQDAVRKYNARLDKQQMGRLEALKRCLEESHSECEKAILFEVRFVDSHQSHLAKCESTLKSMANEGAQEVNSNNRSIVDGGSESHVPLTLPATSTNSVIAPTTASMEHPDSPNGVDTGRVRVLEPFTDYFHKQEVSFAESMVRMEAERQRLLGFSVAVKNAHDDRLAFLAQCDAEMETCEATRCDWLRRALKELVESLTKVGYASITASHVLAQQAIHSMNEHLCRSHAARKSLLAQLRCREVLRQRRYSRQIAEIYSAFRKLMIDSSVCWATTLLRTAHFREPRSRIHLVERMGALAATIRRDGEQFVDNVATTVRSLRHERQLLPSDCGQMCGGTLPDGWLRGFDGGLFSSVFASSPTDVAVEWRVKANVLVRNVIAQCVNLSEEVSGAESELCDAAQKIEKELLDVLEWICTPCPDEASMWLAASTLGATPAASVNEAPMRSVDGDQSNSDSVSGVDDVYVCFTRRNSDLLNSTTTAVTLLTTPLLEAIRRESQWFVSTVRAQMRRQHTALEGTLLRDPENLLHMFQWATDALERTVTSAFGFIRERLVAIQNARLDHNDALRHLDEELSRLVTRLRRAATQTAANQLFTDGIAVLQRIADEHTGFHRATVEALAAVARDGPAEAQRHSAGLLRRLGLEGKEACERRMARERAEAAAAEEAEASAMAMAAGRKGRAAREAAAAAAAAAALATEDAEESPSGSGDEAPDFPLVEASDGTLYYVVAPLALMERPESREAGEPTGRKSSRGKAALKLPAPQRVQQQQQQQQQQQENQGRRKMSVHGRSSSMANPPQRQEPDLAFVQLYESLLQEAIDGGEVLDSPPDALEEWRAVLRIEILNWTVCLCANTTTLLTRHCVDAKAAVDAETNSVMRNHRRRSATLQADAYEGRIREIVNAQMTENKICTRLLERVTAACETWDAALASTDAHEAREEKLFEQLRNFERNATVAYSIAALQTQEQEFTALVTTFSDDRERRGQQFLAVVTKEHDLLETDVRTYLTQCGRDIPEDLDGPEASAAGAEDSESASGWQRAIVALRQLRTAAQSVREQIKEKNGAYEERLVAARNSYATVYEQNVEELTMLARLQDVLSRLKLQVHSMILLSEAGETKLEELTSAFEERLATPVPVCDLGDLIRNVIQRHIDAATSHNNEMRNSMTQTKKDNMQIARPNAAPVDVGGSADITEERARGADAHLHERLTGLHAETQRDIRASGAAKILHLLDELRGALYVRGRHLDCLQYGVELFHVPPESYIEPRLAGASLPPRQSPSPSERRPKSKAPQGASGPASASAASSAALYAPVPPPEAAPAAAQVAEWVAAARAQAGSIADAHFAAVAPPLLRRLQGMAGGTPADVIAYATQLCEQQQSRATAHIHDAAQRYRDVVRRLRRALDRLPGYITQATYGLSAAALERRLDAVFGVFAEFYGESDARRTSYDRLVKVTLATSHNRDRVAALCAAESLRQDVTRAAIDRFSVYALREFEEEAAMHAVRALNANHTAVALTRGIVTTEHLRPCDDDETGTHRGLRRLLRLREREERARELQQQAAQSVRRERRLQETMPRHRHEERETRGRRGEPARTSSLEGDGTLPLLPVREVEYGTVPLQAFRPLQAFAAQHPTAALALMSPGATSATSAPAVGTSAQAPQTQTQPQPAGTGKRGVRETKEESEEQEKAQTGGTVALVAPATLLHKETAVLTHRSVDLFNAASKMAADKAVDTFSDWAKRETMWKQTWSAAIRRLEA